MDWTAIFGIIAAVFGGAGGALLFWRWEREKRRADAHKTEAEADEIESHTLAGVIGVLRVELDRLQTRVSALEKRVSALECENRGLRKRLAQFRAIVMELWDLITDHQLPVNSELTEAVQAALEDDAA